jgi:hypothetical protein
MIMPIVNLSQFHLPGDMQPITAWLNYVKFYIPDFFKPFKYKQNPEFLCCGVAAFWWVSSQYIQATQTQTTKNLEEWGKVLTMYAHTTPGTFMYHLKLTEW